METRRGELKTRIDPVVKRMAAKRRPIQIGIPAIIAIVGGIGGGFIDNEFAANNWGTLVGGIIGLISGIIGCIGGDGAGSRRKT